MTHTKRVAAACQSRVNFAHESRRARQNNDDEIADGTPPQTTRTQTKNRRRRRPPQNTWPNPIKSKDCSFCRSHEIKFALFFSFPCARSFCVRRLHHFVCLLIIMLARDDQRMLWGPFMNKTLTPLRTHNRALSFWKPSSSSFALSLFYVCLMKERAFGREPTWKKISLALFWIYVHKSSNLKANEQHKINRTGRGWKYQHIQLSFFLPLF